MNESRISWAIAFPDENGFWECSTTCESQAEAERELLETALIQPRAFIVRITMTKMECFAQTANQN